jgi:hypothetical protein
VAAAMMPIGVLFVVLAELIAAASVWQAGASPAASVVFQVE